MIKLNFVADQLDQGTDQFNYLISNGTILHTLGEDILNFYLVTQYIYVTQVYWSLECLVVYI